MRLPVDHIEGWSRRDQSGLETITRKSVEAAQQLTRVLSRRSACQAGENSASCDKPISGNTGTLPIVLGAVIPLSAALIVFFFLHRRIKRKQRVEDANDPHKSLDFGAGMPVNRPGKGKGPKGLHPEMTITDLSGGGMSHSRGLSMDMLGSPYMLPAGLHGSRESLRSMSRSIQDEHDPYRPVAWAGEPMGSPRLRPENGSMYSASTMNTTTNENANLVAHARPMSQSIPRRGDSASPPRDETSGEMASLHQVISSTPSFPPRQDSSQSRQESQSPSEMPPPPVEKDTTPFQDEFVLPVPPIPEESSQEPPPRTSSNRKPAPAPIKVHPPSEKHLSDTSHYEDEDQAAQHHPDTHAPYPEIMEPDDTGYDIDPALISTGRFSIDTPNPSQQYPVQSENRVSVMGLRPLPPDNPEENAEQRANRIRSFYREYFDDSKPNPSGQYEEDWDSDFLEGAVYDPDSGGYFFAGERPFAQPVGRRAMTPPPGGARPRFGAHDRHHSTMSGGRRMQGRPPQKPKKKLPPPKPLTSLPTPHMLKEDNMVLTPIDFAPPNSFRDAQNGRRADSPMGIQRPFSPNVRVYSPLVPASDELMVMPSPHHLRKSGTFTGLDFAKLPRFKGQEGQASDAGSIRSARSGISALQIDAVRAGAYRVSRIPKEMVTTRDDMMLQLRPKMDLISKA